MLIETWLFIGGVADGEIRPLVAPLPTVEVDQVRKIQFVRPDTNPVERPDVAVLRMDRHRYRRHQLHAQGTAFAFYQADELTDLEALAMLLANYRPSKGKRA